MKRHFVVGALIFCAHSFGMSLFVTSYSNNNFEECIFSWQNMREFHEAILYPSYGVKRAEERCELIDISFEFNHEIFKAGKSTLELLTSNAEEHEKLEGFLTLLNNPNFPVIVQMVSQDPSNYPTLINRVLDLHPLASHIGIVMPNNNHVGQYLLRKADAGDISTTEIPRDAVAESIKDKATCFELPRAQVAAICEELINEISRCRQPF